jgi:hypothetical protein
MSQNVNCFDPFIEASARHKGFGEANFATEFQVFYRYVFAPLRYQHDFSSIYMSNTNTRMPELLDQYPSQSCGLERTSHSESRRSTPAMMGSASSHPHSWPGISQELHASLFERSSNLFDRVEVGFDLPIQSFQSSNGGYSHSGL